jgi:uncharacterized membrane protein YdjX (TVP38/TMEM64 family)
MGHAIAQRTVLAARHPATIVALVLAAMFGTAVLINPATWDTFTAVAAGDKDTLRSMILSFGPFAPIASIFLNIAQAVVAPVPGFVVPFVNGAVFGTWQGMLITWIGGVAAASTCFWIARTFGKNFAHKICSQFKMAETLNTKLERHAFPALIMARLVPGVPFDFLSYFVGLTRVRFTPFAVATAIGSAPHAYLYAFMGNSLEIPIWMGILMTPALGLVYAAVKWIVTRVRSTTEDIVDEIHVTQSLPALAIASAPRPRTAAAWFSANLAPACPAVGRVPLASWSTSPASSRPRPVLR